MKILITGGAGFIGSHVTSAFIQQGHTVVVIDNLSAGKRDYVHKKAIFYQVDVQSSRVAQIFETEKPDVVIHNAAHISVARSVEDPVNDAQHNIIGSLNILEQARVRRVKKILFASSGGAIYGQAHVMPTPEDYPFHAPFCACFAPYCVAKYAIEHYLMYYQLVHGMSFVALRFPNVYGPRQNANGEGAVVPMFIHKLLKKEQPVIYGDGTQTRDFVYVDDVVQAYIMFIEQGVTGFYNVSTGHGTPINTLYQTIAKLMKTKIEPRYGPARAGEVTRSVLDASKIRRELGWKPTTSLETGLRKTVAWFKQSTTA